MTKSQEKKALKSNLKKKYLMTQKKDFSPTVKKLKDIPMDHIDNTAQFESYLKTKTFTSLYDQMLWGEGPCYIPHKDMLVWSDNPNNRMMKLVNGQVTELVSNLEFGGKEDNTLYVTATSSLYAMELNQIGAKFPV